MFWASLVSKQSGIQEYCWDCEKLEKLALATSPARASNLHFAEQLQSP
jgi:hypothetical protein